MSCRNALMNHLSVSESALSASMSFNAVRFYSCCAFYYYGWRSAAGQRT